jgi:TRAP-type C4-dicarboxylate transport system permease small subunit
MSQRGSPNAVGRVYRLCLSVVDRVTDTLTLVALVAMVVVVTWQVFCRYVLGFTPVWASETALLLLGWIAFLGIAKGIRDHSHIALGMLVDRLPKAVRLVVLRLAPLLMLVFGGYLIVQGGEFTQLMMSSTLPATGLPTSVQYAAMPVAGVLILLYSALQLFGLLPLDGAEDVSGQETRPGEQSLRDEDMR